MFSVEERIPVDSVYLYFLLQHIRLVWIRERPTLESKTRYPERGRNGFFETSNESDKRSRKERTA